MRRYTLEVGGRSFTVDVDELAADRFAVSVEGASYEVVLTRHHDLPAATITPVATIPASVARTAADSVPESDRSVADARRAGTVAAGASGHGELVRAPIPAVVLELLVVPGASVDRGDGLAILDAMKMRNVIRAPHAGIVGEICVQPGQPVALGDPLVRLDPSPGDGS